MQNQSPFSPARWQALNEAGIVHRDELNLKGFLRVGMWGMLGNGPCIMRGRIGRA